MIVSQNGMNLTNANVYTLRHSPNTATITNAPVSVSEDSHLRAEHVVVIVIGILSVLANAFLLYVMFKDPLKTFRSSISYLVICLGTADLMTAFNGILYGFLFPSGMYHVSLWYAFWTTVMVSVLTEFGMCVERWLAIMHPFKSASIITKKITVYFCIAVWIVCTCVASSIHFLTRIMPFVISCFMELILIAIVILYIVILRYFRKAQKQTSVVENVTPQKTPAGKTEGDGESAWKRKRRSVTKKASLETQLLIVISILVVISFLTFIPYNLGTQLNYGYLLFSDRPPSGINIFRRYFFPVKFLNFLINPFVYAWRLDQYRKSFALVTCNRK